MADEAAAMRPTPGAGKQTSRSGGSKWILYVIGAMILLAILFAIGIIPKMHQNSVIQARANAIAHEVPKVGVTRPQPSPASSLILPGNTLAIEDAVVGARTTGYITKRYVDIGAHVHAGQVLAEIESPDVDQQLYQANAQVAQAQATVAQSKADVANKQATVTQLRSNVRQSEANREQARAQLSDTKAKLAQLESAEKTAEAQRDQAQADVGIKQAALRQANTQSKLAQVTYQRYETLLKSGYVALQDVDQNRANFENAQAAVSSAQSDLNAAQKAVDAADANVRAAQSNVASGQAEVNAAEKNVRAVAATVSAAQSTVDAAIANVHQSQSTLAANRYAQVANQANSKRYAVLTSFEKVVAPFDGVITARNVDVGALVNAGSGGASGGGAGGSTSATDTANIGSASTSSAAPATTPAGGLFGIARTNMLRILVSVPQAYAPLMHPGLTTQITLLEFPGRTFAGTVTNVSGALDTTSRTLLTEIHLPNPEGQLLPGMYAQIAFDLPKVNTGLRVPATAVIYDAQGTRAAVIMPQNKIHFAPVQVGRDFNTELEIVAGIQPNDMVVTNPSDDLIEGEKVNPALSPPSSPASQATQGGKQPSAGPKPPH